MDPTSPIPDFTAFYIQEIGALLFGLVFLFLYRQSRVVYFGLWSIAWLLRFLAVHLRIPTAAHLVARMDGAVCGVRVRLRHRADCGGARGFRFRHQRLAHGAAADFHSADLRGAVYAFGWFPGLNGYRASDALVLCGVYVYNFVALRKNTGLGARVFRLSLVVLAAGYAAARLRVYRAVSAWIWGSNRTSTSFCCASSALPPWRCGTKARSTAFGNWPAKWTTCAAKTDAAPRPGPSDRAAEPGRAVPARRAAGAFEGVVTVCDMDNFKDVNDRYGHLVGDEILRNIGNLLQSSIRHEDEAFRWGGDEFVILFHNQQSEVARKRMEDISARLREFRVRGYGMLPISSVGAPPRPAAACCAKRWTKPTKACMRSSAPSPAPSHGHNPVEKLGRAALAWTS